jgi:hypothetical protein
VDIEGLGIADDSVPGVEEGGDVGAPEPVLYYPN